MKRFKEITASWRRDVGESELARAKIFDIIRAMPSLKFPVILAIAASLIATAALRAQTLTGITVFSTDANGNIITTAAFNTFGGDLVNNIYVINDPVAQTFLNSGDSGGASAPTGVNIALATGAREFFASVDPTGTTQGMFYGINLFFNGNNTTPRISAFTTINTPTGVANSGTTLANTGGLTTVAGANTLTFVDPSGLTVILTAFNYASTRLAGLPTDYPEDLVGPFATTPNMNPDNYVDFTLTVIPEPSTWALMGAGLATLGAICRSRRRAANS